MPAGNASKACWPCRDRKIKCDRKLPACRSCIRSNRKCIHDGIRLSWPRAGKSKRAQFAPSVPSQGPDARVEWFLNVTVADVSLLADLHALKRDKLVKRAPPSLSLSTARPSHICGFDLGCSESALLAYCAYLGDCLEQHSHHQLLLQMAFANDSLPSSAVLQAMFALSCLYLERPANAKAHKARALSALRVAMGQTFGYVEQLQHIATHMLLCLLEHGNPYGEWKAHKRCAITLLGMLDDRADTRVEANMLFSWVYHYEVMTKFTRCHWAVQDADARETLHLEPINTALSFTQTNDNILGCSTKVLQVISAACDLVKPDGRTNKCGNESTAQLLKQQLDIAQEYISNGSNAAFFAQLQRREITAELYRIAGLVYVLRAASDLYGSSQEVVRLVDIALGLLTELGTFDRSFPLLIVACEAGSDAQRRQVLDLFGRTRTRYPLKGLLRTQKIVEASWTQDDLHLSNGINYHDKLTAVISSGTMFPLFS